jgi:hypothetical protein
MHNSPTAKQMLEKLKEQGVITPTKTGSVDKGAQEKGDGEGDAIFEAALSAAGGLPPAPYARPEWWQKVGRLIRLTS